MQSETLYLRSVALKGLPEFIEKLGGDYKAIFSQVGLDPERLMRGDTVVSWIKACNVLELAAKELNEPQFGLKWALDIPQDIQNSGPMYLLAGLCPDVRSFVQLAMKYHRVHTNGATNEFVEDTKSGVAFWKIYLHPLTPSCRQYCEHVIGTAARMAPFLNEIRLSHIYFQHNEPEDMSLYESLFECPVTFNAPDFQICATSKNLDKKVGGYISFLKPLLDVFLNRRIRKHKNSEKSVSNMIMEVIPPLFGAKKSDAISVAKALDLSPKKMQRLLKDEDANFSDIRDQVRHDMAKRLLIESDIPISYLATTLDYASTEALNAACKRWCGLPPREYRKQLRGIL